MHWLYSPATIVDMALHCHTVDEYVRVLWEIRDDRRYAMLATTAENQRMEEPNLDANDPFYKRELAQHIDDLANYYRLQPAFEMASSEVDFLDTLITYLLPYCKGTPPQCWVDAQTMENSLATLWQGVLDVKAYGAPSGDILNLVLTLGLEIPTVNNRKEFYESLNLDGYTHVLTVYPELENLKREFKLTDSYIKAIGEPYEPIQLDTLRQPSSRTQKLTRLRTGE